MSLDPDAQRRLSAKRTNERIKLVYSTLNAFAIGIVIAGVIVPGVSSPASLIELPRLIWFSVAGALHIAAQVFVGTLRSED